MCCKPLLNNRTYISQHFQQHVFIHYVSTFPVGATIGIVIGSGLCVIITSCVVLCIYCVRQSSKRRAQRSSCTTTTGTTAAPCPTTTVVATTTNIQASPGASYPATGVSFYPSQPPPLPGTCPSQPTAYPAQGQEPPPPYPGLGFEMQQVFKPAAASFPPAAYPSTGYPEQTAPYPTQTPESAYPTNPNPAPYPTNLNLGYSPQQ